MKRIAWVALLLAFATQATPAGAHDEHQAAGGHEEHMMAGAKKVPPQTITGEVVDTGCYLGHAATGEKHISCAAKCIDQGMPMGLLTSNGRLYLLTLNHDNADPYNKLKEMAGRTVAVTGAVMDRGGMKGIDVEAFKPAATASN
jgi:hypothetical protein